LAGQVGYNRQIWLKRLATYPQAYVEAACCRAPLVPLLTRDVLESGLVCFHCGSTAVPVDDLPDDIQPLVRSWAEEYSPVHAVAHWEDDRRKQVNDYEKSFDEAASRAETLLAFAGHQLIPRILEVCTTVIWEDHDECLDVRPEDVKL
jgi:hypothetical protein